MAKHKTAVTPAALPLKFRIHLSNIYRFMTRFELSYAKVSLLLQLVTSIIYLSNDGHENVFLHTLTHLAL